MRNFFSKRIREIARKSTKRSMGWFKKNPVQILAIILIAGWVSQYILTGNRLEWGDFSFFAQGYEAMRISIFDYGQFPWFNPWVSGGVPLYANPQFGLFSLQTILVFIFGAPVGLKLAVIIYTVLGYLSMQLLLRSYFKAPKNTAILLSLLWIFCTFFVAHLPAHFTFVWFMLAPLFVYLALTIKDWKGGVLLGVAFGIMGLSQIHNPFIHIAFICGIIILARLIRAKFNKTLLIGVGVAALTFLVVAGHRLFYAIQNSKQFPREVNDMAPDLFSAVISPFLPLSQAHALSFIRYPQHPLIPHNFNEATAYLGFGLYVVVIIGILYLFYLLCIKKRVLVKNRRLVGLMIAVLSISIICYLMGLGDFGRFSPYNILKHLPVFSDMRVSTRWFIWFNFGLLVFTALLTKLLVNKRGPLFIVNAILLLAVVELFILNVGYQSSILKYEPVLSSESTKNNTFAQTAYFGEEQQLPDGSVIPDDGSMPDAYREFEATSFNLGVLYANDSYVQLHLDPYYRPGHPSCPFEEGCNFVRSNNATVSYWSPNKIVLTRTAAGPIFLNMNNSSYFKINGKSQLNLKVAEPRDDFVIKDTAQEITIESDPSIIHTVYRAVKNRLVKS